MSVDGNDDEPRVSDTELERRMALLPGVSARTIVHEFGRWLIPELTATEAARTRLQRWAKLDCPRVRDDELKGMGDIPILRNAQRLLTHLPWPVRWYLSNHIYVVGCGAEKPAWCGARPIIIGARIIALGNGSDKTTLHEFSHGWLHGEDDRPDEFLSFSKAEKMRGAAEFFAAEYPNQESLQKIVAEYREGAAAKKRRQEREADHLVRAWSVMLRKEKELEEKK